MPRGYTHIPLAVAASCYASAGYSIATLSNRILPLLAGSLATLIGSGHGTGSLDWAVAESGVGRYSSLDCEGRDWS